MDSLLYDCYLCNLDFPTNLSSQWVSTTKNTFLGFNLEEILHNQDNSSGIYPSKLFKSAIKSKFCTQWGQDLNSQGDQDKKLRTYTLFKTDFNLELYLHQIKDFDIRKYITRLRMSAHHLTIETGRHKRPNKIPVDLRVCDICKEIENEKHYVSKCSKFTTPRNKFLSEIKQIFNLDSFDDEHLFIFIMSLNDTELISKFAFYLKECTDINGPL